MWGYLQYLLLASSVLVQRVFNGDAEEIQSFNSKAWTYGLLSAVIDKSKQSHYGVMTQITQSFITWWTHRANFLRNSSANPNRESWREDRKYPRLRCSTHRQELHAHPGPQSDGALRGGRVFWRNRRRRRDTLLTWSLKTDTCSLFGPFAGWDVTET